MQLLGCSHLIPKTNYLPTHTSRITMVGQDRRIAMIFPNQKKERKKRRHIAISGHGNSEIHPSTGCQGTLLWTWEMFLG